MEFLLAFLMALFTAQVDSNHQNAQHRIYNANKAQKKVVTHRDLSKVARPDPDKRHGPIIIIDDTQYKPRQE